MVVFGGLMLSGCESKTANDPKIENSIVVVSGTLTIKSGDEYLLKISDGGIVNITSSKVDLDSYLKKQITVTGMFSGSTLYVDKIQ